MDELPRKVLDRSGLWRLSNHVWPCVTVVVPVRNGAGVIGDCVDAILAQDYPGPAPEIIVVDNGSTDGTAALVEARAGRVILCREPEPGLSPARNTGVRHATHELVAFTDADCRPRPDWLRELVAVARRDPAAVFVGGRITAHRPATAIARFAESLFDHYRAIHVDRPPYIITANLLARRRDLLGLGLFNPDYQRGEDAELAWRAYYFRGARFAYAHQAVVEHVNVSTLSGLWHKGLQHGSGSARLWRDFQRQLGLSPRHRIRQLTPYRNVLRETLGLIGTLWPKLSGHPANPRRFDPFYRAVFMLARQLAFIYRTWFPGTSNPRGERGKP